MIEQKIKKILKEESHPHKPIHDWLWAFGPGKYKYHQWYRNQKEHSWSQFCLVPDLVDEVIKNADPSECLTSNIEYIRECKKWYMENK